MTKNAPDKKDKKKKPSQKTDDLLECLVFLTAHYGRAKSARALTSGLAYNGHSMHPDLFTEAAQRLGLRTQVVKKAKITDISEAVLPAVLILQGKRACVLLSGSRTPEIYDPGTGRKKQVKLRELQQDYAGYCILTQALPEFTNPYAAASEEDHRHWFWSLINQNKGIFAMVLLGAVFINLFGLASPLFIMNVYDRVIPNNAIETGWALGIGALVVFVFDLIMRSLRAYLLDLAGRRVDVIATRRIYDQVLNMRLCERPKSSGAFANMLRDFDSVRDFFTSATITALVDLPFTLFFLFIIYKLGGIIAFILLGLLGAVSVIGLILQVPLKALVRKAARSAEAKHGMLVETIHGLETIKAIGADGAFRARYGALVGENAAYGQSSRMVSGLGINAATFIQQIASVVIVLSGMYLVADGALTVGGLIACVILSGRALAPVGQIANLLTRYHQASGALATLDGIMNKPVERPASRNFLHRPDIKGKITFDQVGFEYPGVKRAVLDKVSFTINPGERVAIIGRIGSGKSTTARLMMGLYEPTAGHILADDTDYQQIDPADLRRSLAYIAQDVVLFTGSVRDNIAASCPSASEEDILAAAKAAGVHEFVSRHPMGYDAPVGEHGEGLSGGQRQAIALARAMLIKPKVLICDEPTNAMDMQAEVAFKSYVENEIEGKTFILITHKHTMLEMVDRLILLDQGRLIMDGPREEVVAALQSGKVQVQG
ncbi:MAG TPA: type I secretion system permease/ATPase [Alphaproteobacteria bacterium]|nr:MAG: type I secretion system permease/ATPase [Rhodospirillales bacterium]HOO81977.1 type I secretion system permease/ATPase [Alphaproteobacteria bacterium]